MLQSRLKKRIIGFKYCYWIFSIAVSDNWRRCWIFGEAVLLVCSGKAVNMSVIWQNCNTCWLGVVLYRFRFCCNVLYTFNVRIIYDRNRSTDIILLLGMAKRCWFLFISVFLFKRRICYYWFCTNVSVNIYANLDSRRLTDFLNDVSGNTSNLRLVFARLMIAKRL